jgi:hypothetical protein
VPAVLVSTDVSKQQNKLANDEGLEVADAFVKAQRRVTFQRNILLVRPCAPLVFSLAALFIHSRQSDVVVAQ